MTRLEDADLAALALIRAAARSDTTALHTTLERFRNAGRLHLLFCALLELATNTTGTLAAHHQMGHDEFVTALELRTMKEADDVS
jgi:hypothetical protein